MKLNEDMGAGTWKQLRGHAKEWWGKLTDDDLDRVMGKRDVLVGLLQEKYGYTRAQADAEIDRRMKEMEPTYAARQAHFDCSLSKKRR